jgi:dTDP-4-amino-4,6-dideoxygalactose transaminase
VRIPFGTVEITETARRLIGEILETGRVSSGKYVREFEKRFADLVGTREAVAVSTGTDADALALAVLHDFGARRGDEVIMPALTFVSTANAVLQAGFHPVFVDINAIARCRGLVVVEDAAEAHGAVYKGKNAGALGAMGAFSLYVAHIISTVEGGIVTTDRADYAEVLRSLRSHGRACSCESCVLNIDTGSCAKRFRYGTDIRFIFERVGFSAKMNELEAAVGLGSLERYGEILSRRRENLYYLMEGLRPFGGALETIRKEPHEEIGPHAFPVILGEKARFSRDEFVGHLTERGIDTRTLFSSIPTQCPGYRDIGFRIGDFPNAEHIGDRGIHIGVHQGLGREDCDYILGDFLEGKG